MSATHTPSLHQFFRHHLQPGFRAHGLIEMAPLDYVSDILARFAQTQVLYALRDSEGRPLEHIVDMLSALLLAQERKTTGGRARERFVIRHLGEYTLFMSGLFRERLAARGEIGYYVEHGRGAFRRCADYEYNQQRRRLYRLLCREFGHISDVLDHMRRRTLPLAPGADSMLAAFWHA